jgi:molecular chaperone IbpA
MTGYDLINSYSKQFFDHGLDTFDKVFDSWSKVSGFPFWNVVKYDKGKYGLEIGLAGYKKSDVLVEVNEGILSVSGKVDDSAVDYVQKNLATREFYKQFQLPNNAIVDEAKMEDGLLKVKFGYKEDANKQTVEVK